MVWVLFVDGLGIIFVASGDCFSRIWGFRVPRTETSFGLISGRSSTETNNPVSTETRQLQGYGHRYGYGYGYGHGYTDTDMDTEYGYGYRVVTSLRRVCDEFATSL